MLHQILDSPWSVSANHEIFFKVAGFHCILDNRIFILYNHNGYMVSFHADLNKLMQIGTSLAMNKKIIVKARIISLKPFIFFHNKKNLTLLRLLLAFANFLSFRSKAKNNQRIYFKTTPLRIFLYIYHLTYIPRKFAQNKYFGIFKHLISKLKYLPPVRSFSNAILSASRWLIILEVIFAIFFLFYIFKTRC